MTVGVSVDSTAISGERRGRKDSATELSPSPRGLNVYRDPSCVTMVSPSVHTLYSQYTHTVQL